MPIAALAAMLLAQTTPIQDMPKGTGLPPPGTEEASVMAPVNALFAGIAASDPAAIARTLREGGSATAVDEKADGTRTVRRIDFATLPTRFQPGGPRMEERMSDPAIEVDGDIAMVWGPYVFLIDGKLHHCGVDHFDLVRENGSWKIANLTWSSRTTGCQ
jgi:hypothetical protein